MWDRIGPEEVLDLLGRGGKENPLLQDNNYCRKEGVTCE